MDLFETCLNARLAHMIWWKPCYLVDRPSPMVDGRLIKLRFSCHYKISSHFQNTYIGALTLLWLFRTFQQFVLDVVFKTVKNQSIVAMIMMKNIRIRARSSNSQFKANHLFENQPKFWVTVVNESTKCISVHNYFHWDLSFGTFCQIVCFQRFND